MAKPLTTVESTCDALDTADLSSLVASALDDLSSATSVETMDDMRGNLAAALESITKAQNALLKLYNRTLTRGDRRPPAAASPKEPTNG